MWCNLVIHVSIASSNACFIPTVMQIGNNIVFLSNFSRIIGSLLLHLCWCETMRPVWFQLYRGLHTTIQAFTNVFNCHCIDCVESWSYYQHKFITVIFPSLSLSHLHFSSIFSTLPSLLPHHEVKIQRTQNKNKEAKG